MSGLDRRGMVRTNHAIVDPHNTRSTEWWSRRKVVVDAAVAAVKVRGFVNVNVCGVQY